MKTDIWITRMKSEMQGKEEPEAEGEVLCDNEKAVNLCHNPVSQHSNSKHIDIRYHRVRQAVETKEITLKWVRGKDNKADILTKPLPRPQFIMQRNRIMCNNRMQGF